MSVPECSAKRPRCRARAVIAVSCWLSFVASTMSGCSLDGLAVQELTRHGHQRMPTQAPVVVTGRAPMLPGATVRLIGASGPLVNGVAPVAADGSFEIELDGSTELVNSIIDVVDDGRQALGVVPLLPKQQSVLDPELRLDTKQLSPGMMNVDDVTTTMALLVTARARMEKKALTAIPHGSMTDTLVELHTKIVAKDKAVLGALAAVQRVASVGKKTTTAPFEPFAVGSPLRLAFVKDTGLDADGDGAADGSTAPFDALLHAAAKTFKFKACYVEDKIKVVLMARLAPGAKNRSCDTLDPFLWATDVAGKKMFVAAGVHKTTPICSADVKKGCMTTKQVDELNAVLGNWVPNKTQMYDDGSHGDAIAGDNIWTFAFDAPWWQVAAGARGPRIGYKFTWGSDGAGWGGTEEFPGNQRILELNDRNGDRIITRLDHFADEASNKDKANQLSPAKGGCGTLHWPDETAPKGCVTDVWERPVDIDGDCEVDDWPGAGTAAPLTVQCPGT